MTYNILILTTVGAAISQHPSYEAAEAAITALGVQGFTMNRIYRLYKMVSA